jgi:hypothetical protein
MLKLYFSNDVTSILISYLMASDDHLKHLVFKKFSICIEGYRYTFDYYRSYFHGRYNYNGIQIDMGYSNPDENKRTHHKPYSYNQYRTTFSIPFSDLWSCVIGKLSCLNDLSSRCDHNSTLSQHSDALRYIIRKRMRFRFLANADSVVLV